MGLQTANKSSVFGADNSETRNAGKGVTLFFRNIDGFEDVDQWGKRISNSTMESTEYVKLQAYLPQEFSFGTSSSYTQSALNLASTVLSALTGKEVNTGVGNALFGWTTPYFGRGIYTKTGPSYYLTRRVFTGSAPMDITLPLQFFTKTDPYWDVYRPIQLLNMITSPPISASRILQDPLTSTALGGEAITISPIDFYVQIADYFTFADIVPISVRSTFSTTLCKSAFLESAGESSSSAALPQSATCSFTFGTRNAVIREYARDIFGKKQKSPFPGERILPTVAQAKEQATNISNSVEDMKKDYTSAIEVATRIFKGVL